MILVDSSAWIAYFSSKPNAVQARLEQLLEAPLELATTGLVVCEVLQGARSDRVLRVLEATLLSLTMLAEPRVATYQRAAALYRSARAKGLTIRSTIDCILAAQCIESGASIVHADRDFDALARISELQVHTS